MKLLLVSGDGDYSALIFEDYYGKDLEKYYKLSFNGVTYNKIEGDTIEINHEDNETLYVTGYRFKDVDPKFIEFMIQKIIDYDHSKHKNFFIVEE